MWYGKSMLYKKEFDKWNSNKKVLDNKKGMPSFHIREVRWVIVGVNVQSEICGKGSVFSRPVLILKKSGRMFFGIPLTRTIRDAPGWYKYGNGCLVFDQARWFDNSRVLTKKKKIGSNTFATIQKGFSEYIGEQ